MADLAIHQVVVDLPAVAGTAILLRAPAGKNGGAVMLAEVSLFNKAATSAGNSFSVSLVKLDATGAVLGTVATEGGTAASGTASHWSASGVKRIEVAFGACYLDAGQILAAVATAIGTGTVTGGQAVVHYQAGK